MSSTVLGEALDRVGYALVVTNNRSLDTSRPDLHYADDDGIQYAKLFSEVFGRERVILLTQPDAGTMQLYPGWGATAIPPTRHQLNLAIDRLARAINADKQRGRHVAVHVVFAGHGDLHEGQGFIALEDGRFTASDLDEDLIAKLGADRIHLIIDSCNAYFMLNPRGPGVKRWSIAPHVHQGLLDKYPQVGALISTSAEAVTYEWSELQSGIFSYEVRSALRGAADVDGSAGVSYAEVAAFVHVSNQTIVNELYRPKMFVRGPEGNLDETIMPDIRGARREVRLDKESHRRLTIRGANGVRVMDINKEAGTPVRLNLPRDDGTFYVYETKKLEGQARPVTTVSRIASVEEQVDIDSLAWHPVPITSRGEAPVFRDLFKTPFGLIALRNYRTHVVNREAAPYGVSRRDIDRLETHLRLSSTLERKRRVIMGTLGVTLGSNIAANNVVALLWASQTDEVVISSLLAAGAVGYLGFGIYSLARQSKLEQLYDTFLGSDLSTGESRATALVNTERLWREEVNRSQRRRRVRAFVDVITGGVVIAGAATLGALTPYITDDKLGRIRVGISAASYGVLGGAALWAGIWHFRNSTPVEEAWRTYVEHRDGFAPRLQQTGLTVTPFWFRRGGGIAVVRCF